MRRLIVLRKTVAVRIGCIYRVGFCGVVLFLKGNARSLNWWDGNGKDSHTFFLYHITVFKESGRQPCISMEIKTLFQAIESNPGKLARITLKNGKKISGIPVGTSHSGYGDLYLKIAKLLDPTPILLDDVKNIEF